MRGWFIEVLMVALQANSSRCLVHSSMAAHSETG